MKKLAISVILAALNLLLIGVYFLASWRKVGCCGWGRQSRQHHSPGCRSCCPASFSDLHRQGPDTPAHSITGALGSGSFGSQRRNGVLNTPGLKGGAVSKTGHVVLRSMWIILSLAVLLGNAGTDGTFPNLPKRPIKP